MMKRLIIFITAVVFSGCAGTVSLVPSPPQGKSQPLTPPEITLYETQAYIFQLENGLEVLAIRNASSPMVGLNLAIRVGSAYEDYSTSGMSHMLEHLLFNGTQRRTQEELYEETDYYGAYSNAHTDLFFTNFMLLLPAEFIEQGMDIQADMIFNSTLPNTKFTKERGIVMEEIRKDRDREEYAVDTYLRRMNFGTSGVGLPTLGTLSTIEHLSREETHKFYRSHYVPNNMVLTVIGNFEVNRLKELIETYYGAYSPRPLPPHPSTDDPIITGQLNQMKGGVKKAYGQVAFVAPPFEASESLSYELFISILNEELKANLAGTSVSASYLAYPGIGRLVIDFSAEPDQSMEDLFAKVVQELNRIDDNLDEIVTDQRLALWAKQRSVEDYSLLESPHYYGMMRAADLALGGATYVLDKLNAVPRLSSAAVLSHLQGFSQADHHFNLYYPETVEDTIRADVRVTYQKSVLPSGAVLVTSSGGGSRMFGMHILIKNRHVLEDSLEGGAEILHSLLESGTDRYTREQIQDKLRSLGATLKVMDMGFIPYDDYYNRPDYGYIRFECLAEDAREGISFVAHLLDNTVLTDDKLTQALSGARRRVGMQRGTGRFTATHEFNRLLLGAEHPLSRTVSGSPESLGRINLDNMLVLQKTYFHPGNYLISISSPLSHDELAGLFNSIWLDSGSPTPRVTTPVPLASSRQEAVIELGKEQAQIRLGYAFKVAADDKPVINVITSLLAYKMAFDLRETRGLAYNISLADYYDGDTAWLVASMGTGIHNLPEAITGLKSYLDPKKLTEVTQRELTKTINADKGRTMRRNLTRVGQAYSLGYYEYYEGDYSHATTKQSELDRITLTDLRRVARKVLPLPQGYTLVIVK